MDWDSDSLRRTLGQLTGLACLVVTLFASGCATSGRLTPEERMAIAGRTYVVTGASSGIGRGVALRLGELAGNVVLASRRKEELLEVAKDVEAAGGSALVVVADVSKPEDLEKLKDAAVAKYHRIDVWINNAAVLAIGQFTDIPASDHSRIVDVNLKGAIYGSHIALRQFRAQGSGSLINMGSVESKIPLAYHASYAATKAAILALDNAIHEELRLAELPDVHVSTVMPWAVDTPLMNVAANYTGRAGQMAAFDDPATVVNAVVWVSLYPQREMPVGWKAESAVMMARAMPGVALKLSSDIAYRQQMTMAPPSEFTSGNLYQPADLETEVDGGIRERMRRTKQKGSEAAH